MQRRHLYIVCYAVKAANVAITYWAKHEIVNNYMV
jgi:hypothetical protein